MTPDTPAAQAPMPPRRPRFSLAELSPTGKAIIIVVLVTMLLIPLLLVKGLVDERAAYAWNVRSEIAQGWGDRQAITGPFLVVPYIAEETEGVDSRQTRREVSRSLVVLPERFEATASASTEVLRRAIYAVTGYQADIALSGSFAPVSASQFPSNTVRIDWARAALAIGLSDPSGLRDGIELRGIGDEAKPFSPSLPGGGYGVQVSPVFDVGPEASGVPALPFRIGLRLAGSDELTIAPVGLTSVVKLQSDWPHPGFVGSFLPTERNVAPGGFQASWTVPDLARPVAQTLVGVDTVMNSFYGQTLGVRFIDPVDFYLLVDRAVKYGILFLVAAFGGVFAMELASRGRFHPMQYLFVGVAIVLFYVLLLALAEIIGFSLAYLVAATSLVGQLASYVGVVLRSRSAGLTMAGVLVVAFGLLFGLLQLQAYALLVGAVAAFVALTAAMFLTLRVDWSAVRPAEPASGTATRGADVAAG